MLLLRPAHTNGPAEEKSCKKSLVDPIVPSGLKMVFALLTEVIAVHMWLIIIHLWYLSLESPLALRWSLFRSLGRFLVGLHEFFEQFIGRGRSGNRSGNQSGNLVWTWGGVTRQSERGTPWMRTSNWARVSGKLIFHRVSRRWVPTRETTEGTTRVGASERHLENSLDWIR